MNDNELKVKLVPLPDTLKKNKTQVPLIELKTKYKKGYDKLCREISAVSSLDVSQTDFHDMRIRKDLLPEAAALAD